LIAGSTLGAIGGDRPWLIVMAAMIAAEFIWWAVVWMAGIAPPPFFLTHLAIAAAALGIAFAVRKLVRRRSEGAAWISVIAGTLLFGIGSALFLPLKYAIPSEIPFWLDVPLAEAERHLFGADPWILLDRALGWAVVPIDRIYGLWLPVQAFVFFTVLLEPSSPAKSRALIAYSLAWFVLGVAAAVLLSSAGPLFYDRLYGGRDFGLLGETLRSRGAWVAIAESDTMWAAKASNQPGLVAGVSAVPSLHVAISLWFYLAARSMAPRFAWLGLAYFIFIWVASVQLGWHYVSDGLAGSLGMLALWAVAGLVERSPRS
jgi:hypothetical protein